MILGGSLGFFAGLLLAAAGLVLSPFLLARRAGDAPPLRRLPRPLSGWDFLLAALIFFGGGLLLVGWTLRKGGAGQDSLGAQIATLGGAILAWGFLRLRSGPAPREPAPGPVTPGWLVSTYAFALPGLLAVSWITNSLYRVAGSEAPTQGVIESLKSLSGFQLAGLALVAVFLQPVLEEVLFRGYLWRFLAGREDFGPRRALLFSSLAFALAHERGAWLPALYLGLLFGWVRWRTGRTRYAVMIHMLHNGLVTAWVLSPFASGVTL